MNKPKYFVLVFATKADSDAGEQAYEFDCDTVNEAYDAADSEVDEGNYAAAIHERSGTTAPSICIGARKVPKAAA